MLLALLPLLALAAPAAPAPSPKPTPANSLVQVDVALVRAAPRADAPVVTRLPINTAVEVLDEPRSADGYLAVRVRTGYAMARDENDAVKGYIREDLLGPVVRIEDLENRIGLSADPQVRLQLLDRLVALRGDLHDVGLLLGEAESARDFPRIAHAKQLLEPQPTVIGVCFGGRVAILASLEGGRLSSLVEEREGTSLDAPEVRTAASRLRARALELTTTRFYGYSALFGVDSAYLLQPSVVTTEDVMGTVRSHIELGPCPYVSGEVDMSPAIMYASNPIAEWGVIPALQAGEVAPLLGKVNPTLDELHVAAPAPDLLEVDATTGNWVFQRGKGSMLACTDPDRCADRLLRPTRVPAWFRLESGERIRIGSETEAATNAGWGSPDNNGLWVSPIFVIDLFDAERRLRELVVTLDIHGC